jgi:hypothetical protein
MTGKPFYKTRTITSERLVSPLAGRRDLNDAAIAFKKAVSESITRPTLNAGLSVKALSDATGNETYQDTDGKKRTSSGGTPGMVELPNGYNYVPSQKWEEGKFLQLFPSIKSRKTVVKKPNFGWVDKSPSLTASEYAKVLAASPKLRIRKYKVNQKTDEIIEESEQTLDPFSLNGDKTVATSGYGEKRLPGKTIGQRGRSLIARAANAFGIIVDEAGKFRCPPGTPAANQFTDSTGANCFGVSASDIFDFAQRMASGIDLGDGAKIRNSAKGLFSFLSWLDNGGIPGLGRTVWRDQDGKRIRNIKKWREASRTSQNSRIFVDGMIRAQDKLAQQDINIASLMDMLGVIRTDEKRKTNEDIFEALQKLRDSGAWTLDVSTRFSAEDVDEIIKARLSHIPGFSALAPERQKSLIEADTERWYTTERALLESALDSFIADPEHMRTIKSIDFEIKNPFGPEMDEASTGGFTTPDTNRLMTVIRVDIPEIMNNQEALIPNLAPNERMRIDFIGGKTDSERATALTNFLVTVDGQSKQLAAMVEERAFARHIMKHEIAHTIQFQAFVREAERQIRTNGFINAVNHKGEVVRVENIKDLNSGMIFRLMQKAGDGMDLESLKNALSRTDVVGFLAGDYPKMYFNDEKGAEWWALEAAAELWALRDLGLIYGDDIDAALEWMDDVSDGRYTDIRRRSDADGLLDIEARHYENLGPDPELSGNSIAEVKARLDMEHKREMSWVEGWSEDPSTTIDDFVDALAGLEFQREAYNDAFDNLEASGERTDSPGFKELNRKIKENNAKIALIEKKWAERFSSEDKDKRRNDMKKMRESVRKKMYEEGMLRPEEMAVRAREEEIGILEDWSMDDSTTSENIIDALAFLQHRKESYKDSYGMLESSGISKDSSEFEALNKKIKENNEKISLLEKNWADRFSSPDKEKRSEDIKSMRESVREKMFSEGTLRPKEMAARARQEEIKNLKRQVNDMTPDEVIQKLADIEISLKEAGLSADAKSVLLEDKKMIRAIYKSKLDGSDDAKVWSKQRRELDTKIDELVNPPKQQVLKKTKKLKTDKAGSSYAKKIQQDEYYAMSEEQGIAVERLGNPAETDIGNLLDPDGNVAAIKNINRRYRRAQRSAGDLSPGSETAALEDQIEKVLIPAMEAIDESSIPDDLEIEAEIYFGVTDSGFKDVSEYFDSQGFISGRIITDESPHKPGEVRDADGDVVARAGKEKTRVVVQVSKGDKGLFGTRETILGEDGVLVLPPGKMKVVDRRPDGTMVLRVQEQDNVVDVLDRLSAAIGEEGPGASQHAKGTKKKIDRVANKYVAQRRENGLSSTPSRPKREVEIEDKNVEVKREVISAGGSFGEPPSEDYVAEIGKAPLVQPAEADIKPDPVDPRTGRPQMRVVSRMNIEELVNRRAAVYRNLLDPDYANDRKGFQGTDRATLKSLDDELAKRGEIITNLPQPPDFDPDYLPGSGKRAPYKTSAGSISDPTAGREALGIPQTREERKVVRATRANFTMEDVKRVLAGESPKEVMNDMSRESLDPAVADVIARKSPEAIIKDIEDAAVEFHAGIDKRPRVRMTENQLTKFANDGEFLPTETDETVIPGDAIGRRLERRLNPRTRRESPKLSSGAKYEELVRNQPRPSDEQINAASDFKQLSNLPELSKEDVWEVTGKDPFGDDIEEMIESPERKKIKDDIKKSIEKIFTNEIDLDRDIIVESTSGEKINLGKKLKVSAVFEDMTVQKMDENDIAEQNTELGEQLFESPEKAVTQITLKIKFTPADEDAAARLIKSGLPESLIDPDGTDAKGINLELGNARRTIATDGDRVVIGHETLFIGKGARKYGIASAVNARNESLYKELGADFIFTQAQSSSGADQTGATHWARNGFTWMGEPSKQEFIGVIDEALTNTPEVFSDEERTRISSLYKKGANGKFTSSASAEDLVDFAAADDVFAEISDGDGKGFLFKRDLNRGSGIDAVRNRARRRERSGARDQMSPSLSSGAKVYRKIGRAETFQNENELGVKRGKEISEEPGKLSSGAIEKTLKPGDLKKSPAEGFARKEGRYGEERKTFEVYNIGGESVVFGGPTEDFEMESETDAKNVLINPYAITGLDKTSKEGQELSEKWAAAHAAHVEETGGRSTYVDALLYASVRGDEDATKEFERLSEIGLKRVAEEKEKAIERISFSEDDLFQERKEGLDKIGIDDLYLVHETEYDPPLDADGNIVLKPLSAYELTSDSGEKVTVQRHTIHFALNHMAGGHIARQQKPGSNVIVVRLRDVLENNPDSVDSLFPVDTVLTPKPGGGIKMPKGSFQVVKTTEDGDSNDMVRTALKELGAKHFFQPGEFSSSPGTESAVRRIAKDQGFYYQIHSNMPHSFMEMNASGTEEQLGRLSTFELWPEELARMSKNAQKSVGISDKFTGTRNMMVDDGSLLSGLRTNARVSPKQRKIQLQKVNDAENYLRNLDLQIAEVDLVDSETGKKIKSPIFSVAGRPMVLVDVNGIRIPFYQSTGKGGKSNPIGKWYPIFGVGKSDLIFDREFGRFVDRGGWFNKGDTYESIDNYYGVPEFKRIANILNDIDDMTEIDFHNVGAIASEEETFELLKKNGSTGYAGSKLPKARMSINDDLWKEVNRDLTPYSTVGEAERSGGRRWDYINSVIDRIEKNRVKLDINSVSVAVDKDKTSVSKESSRIKNRDVQLTVKDKNGDAIKVSIESELKTRFDDTEEQNLTVRMMANGVEVGVLHARTDLGGELGNRGELTISDILVPEDYHRRGHGRLMLSLAEKYNIGSEKINHSSKLSELGELFAGGTDSGRLSSGARSGPSKTQRIAGIAGSRATGRLLDAVLKRSGADEDTRERVKYGVNMAGALAAGGPAGFATALAVDVARRAGREIAERGLAEAVERGKITQEQMNVAMSAVDRVAPNGLPDPVVDKIADAWGIASDFMDERVITDENMQRLDEFGNVMRAEGNEFVENAGELVGSAREKIGRRFGRRKSKPSEADPFGDFDPTPITPSTSISSEYDDPFAGFNENDYTPAKTEYDPFGDSAFSSGKRAGRSSDAFREEYNSRIGISKSTPNSAKPVSGYVVHRSHNEEKKRQIAASGKGNIGSDAIFEIGDNDIVGDGLTALGEIEVILKPEVSNRTAYGRGDALQSAHRPVAMNSSDPDDIADAIMNADGIASKKQNTEAMLHLLGAKMDKNFSSVGASMDENGKMVPVGAVDSSARSHEPFEAQILGGFKKNEVEGIHYPYSKVAKIAESEDISDVVNEKSLASKLEKLGFTPEEIAYFYSISGGRPLNTASMVKLKEYRAAKKIKEQYEGMGIGYVKFAHPQGINIENPRSYDKTASSKTRVDEILMKSIDAEVEAELKKTLDSIRKGQQLDLMVD